MHDISIFTAGGTIDKRYNPIIGALEVGDPVIGSILARAGLRDGYPVITLLQKDSLDMTDSDREHVAGWVAASLSQRILITHGTDTMNETARHLAARPDIREKTIVLTGAMVPHGCHDSDATFNIGFAYASLSALPPGIYIAFHGEVWPHDTYVKDRELGRFFHLNTGTKE